jgi:hypothetical protein
VSKKARVEQIDVVAAINQPTITNVLEDDLFADTLNVEVSL